MSSKIEIEIDIEITPAVDSPSLADEFEQKHRASLERFGVQAFSSCERLRERTDAFLVVARVSGIPGAVAGMRLDAAGHDAPLPAELALRTVDVAAADAFAAMCTEDTAEACAWWVVPAFAGAGLPAILMRAGVAAAPSLWVPRLFAFPHQHTRAKCSSFGFRAVESIGHHGEVQYPTPSDVSTVTFLDSTTLDTTPPEERRNLVGLRSGVFDRLVEHTPRGPVLARYPRLRRPRSVAPAAMSPTRERLSRIS